MPTFRHKMAGIVGAVMVVSLVLLAGGPSLAQTAGYPPGTSVPSCTPGNVNAGNALVGQTVTFSLCGDFADGASVTVSANGVAVLTKTPTNGAVTVVVTIVSSTELQVGDPVSAPGHCGPNAVAATGASASGPAATVTGTFTLVCASPTTVTTGSTGTTASTGTTVATAPPATSVTTQSPLAFTGAHIFEALLIAAVLIAVGTALVMLQRRRRTSQ